MLLNFSIENFLSFKKNQTMSLETGAYLRKHAKNTFKVKPTNYGGEIKLIKSSIIFGSNGSGKTNLTSGLAYLKNIVLKERKSIRHLLPYSPFLLDENGRNKPVQFEIEFISNTILYKYSVSYNRKQIFNEILSIYDKKSDDYTNYIERINGEITIFPLKFSEYKDEVKANSLCIHVLEKKNDTHSINVIDWFTNKLVLFDSELTNVDILENENNRTRLLKFLKLADMNMVDIVPVKNKKNITDNEIGEKIEQLFNRFIQESGLSENGTIEINRTETANDTSIYTVYNKYGDLNNVVGTEKISYRMESAGTRKLIEVALNILFESDGKIFVFDEFDDAFHQELSEALIRVFNTTSNNAQFILTSHELQLMDNNLRKDQIYFADKNYRGESELYSIFDFDDDPKKGRGDITYYKRYIKGLFGGIPNIDTDSIVNMVNRKD